MAIKFVGVNLVDGKDYTAQFFKVRLSPPAALDMIGEDFGTMTIDGTVEADTDNITTPGLSQYFKLLVEA